jgi:hypothetical protein
MVKGHSGVYDVLLEDKIAYSHAGCCGPLPLPDTILKALREQI